MRLLFEEIDKDLDDYDLLALCCTDMWRFNMIDITRVLEYYRENNFSEYDILVRLGKLILTLNYVHELKINGKCCDFRKSKILMVLEYDLKRLSDRDNVISGYDINLIYKHVKTLMKLNNSYMYDVENIVRDTRDLYELDIKNGGEIRDIISNRFINCEQGRVGHSEILISVILQYIFKIEYTKEEDKIMTDLNIIHKYGNFNISSIDIMLELVSKINNEEDISKFDLQLFNSLVYSYWRYTYRHNLDNLRYLKIEFKDSNRDFINKVVELNDKIDPIIKGMINSMEYGITDSDYEDFTKYKNKLIKYMIDRAL